MDPSQSRNGPEVYRFERFRLDVRERLLTRGGVEVALPPKHFELLLALVRRGGRLATKDELLAEVWPAVVVTEASLAQAVSQLRRALGESDSAESFILTVPKAGYRFGVAVEAASGSRPIRPASPPPPSSSGHPWRQRAWVGGAALGLFVLAFVAVGLRSQAWRAVDPRAEAAWAGEPEGPEARRWQEAREAAATQDWPRAIELFESAFARDPGRVEVGLDLVATLVRAGRGPAAVLALGRLRQLRSPSSEDPRIDLAEAEVALAVSEYQRAAAAASRARESAERQGSAPLRARALGLSAEALRQLDRLGEARQDLELLRSEAEASGDQRALAQAQLGLGAVAYREQQGEVARTHFEDALARFRRLGDRRGEIEALGSLAEVLAGDEDADGARRAGEQAVALAREVGDAWSEGNQMVRLAGVLHTLGDTAAAVALAEQALPRLRASGNQGRLLTVLSNLAVTAIEQGDLAKAESCLDEAASLARQVGNQGSMIHVLRTRAYLAQARGDIPTAGRLYREALELARAVRFASHEAELCHDLAFIELELDRPAEAMQFAADSERIHRELGDLESSFGAAAAGAWARAASGDLAGARARIAELRRLADDPDLAASRHAIASAEAEIAELAGDWAGARQARLEAIRFLEEWGASLALIDERLGLARAEQQLGRPVEAAALARQVLAAAEEQGLEATVVRARALLGSLPVAR